MKRLALNVLAAVFLLASLAGCGFQLRGQAQLPFESAYVDAKEKSALGKALQESLAGQQKLAARSDGAAIRIQLADESHTKNILALSGAGKVKEYRLTHRYLMTVFDAEGKELIAPSEILVIRDLTYSDTDVLAKEKEEAYLRQSMLQDALHQVLRRLSYIKR